MPEVERVEASGINGDAGRQAGQQPDTLLAALAMLRKADGPAFEELGTFLTVGLPGHPLELAEDRPFVGQPLRQQAAVGKLVSVEVEEEAAQPVGRQLRPLGFEDDLQSIPHDGLGPVSVPGEEVCASLFVVGGAGVVNSVVVECRQRQGVPIITGRSLRPDFPEQSQHVIRSVPKALALGPALGQLR